MNFVLGRSGDIKGIILKGTDIFKCCTFLLLLASHAGVFRGACLSSLDERRAPLKMPAWEAILLQVFRHSDVFHSIGMRALFVNYWLLISVITPFSTGGSWFWSVPAVGGFGICWCFVAGDLDDSASSQQERHNSDGRNSLGKTW